MGSPLEDLKNAIQSKDWEAVSLAYTAMTGQPIGEVKKKRGRPKKKQESPIIIVEAPEPTSSDIEEDYVDELDEIDFEVRPRPPLKKVARDDEEELDEDDDDNKPGLRRGRFTVDGSKMKPVDFQVNREKPEIAQKLYGNATRVERRPPAEKIKMTCSSCGQRFKVPPALAVMPQSGKYWRCNDCSVGR